MSRPASLDSFAGKPSAKHSGKAGRFPGTTIPIRDTKSPFLAWLAGFPSAAKISESERE
jgi:hypothetical protein